MTDDELDEEDQERINRVRGKRSSRRSRRQSQQEEQGEQAQQATQDQGEEQMQQQQQGPQAQQAGKNNVENRETEEPQAKQEQQETQAQQATLEPVTQRAHDTFYLSEEVRTELTQIYRRVTLDILEETGVDIDDQAIGGRNRYFRPLALLLGARQLREMSPEEVREAVEQEEHIDNLPDE